MRAGHHETYKAAGHGGEIQKVFDTDIAHKFTRMLLYFNY